MVRYSVSGAVGSLSLEADNIDQLDQVMIRLNLKDNPLAGIVDPEVLIPYPTPYDKRPQKPSPEHYWIEGWTKDPPKQPVIDHRAIAEELGRKLEDIGRAFDYKAGKPKPKRKRKPKKKPTEAKINKKAFMRP